LPRATRVQFGALEMEWQTLEHLVKKSLQVRWGW